MTVYRPFRDWKGTSRAAPLRTSFAVAAISKPRCWRGCPNTSNMIHCLCRDMFNGCRSWFKSGGFAVNDVSTNGCGATVSSRHEPAPAASRRIGTGRDNRKQRPSRSKPGSIESFDPPLDRGIERAVWVLRAAGVETFESCQGGAEHAYPEPTIRFHGNTAEGLRALAAALDGRLPVSALRRVWPVIDGEPTGPWWELTFAS
jgi:hypothetical protein